MQNLEHRASALFSDATTNELLQSSDGSLISDAISRLGLQILGKNALFLPKLSEGYLVAQKDRIIRDIKNLSYGNPLGLDPKIVFSPHRVIKHIDDESKEKINNETNNENIDSNLIPIIVCRRYL